MAFTVELFPSLPCSPVSGSTPRGAEAARLRDYLRPFQAPALHYRVSPRACLAGERMIALEGWRRRPVRESLPFELPGLVEGFGITPLSAGALARLRRRAWLPARGRVSGALCSLLDLRGWQSSFFHWFIDGLPRVLAAEDHQRRSGRAVRLLVPRQLRPWQRESLALLGWQGERLLPLDPVDNQRHLVVEQLISCCARGGQPAGDAPVDAMVPAVIRCLRERFAAAVPPDAAKPLPRRIYVSRADAPARRVRNEAQVMALLGRHGFTRISLDGLSVAEQIGLFRAATHIVAPHGAGLTNLLHARQASVLEIFQPEHGLRPDFLQLAAANGLRHDWRVGTAVGERGDISITPAALTSWPDLPD